LFQLPVRLGHCLVYVESSHTSTFPEEARYIDSARLAWQTLCALALSPEESLGLIAKLIGKLT
jgi:hypothetical protein